MGFVLAIVLIVLMVVCAVKEGKLTGTYKAFGVYGRIKAYFALDLAFAGLAILVGGIVGAATGQFAEYGLGAVFGTILGGLVCLAVGVFLYWSSYTKCPEMLKARCIPSMIISGLGVTIKIAVFFIFAVWKITGPEEVTDENGESLYIISGDVYDGAGRKVGVVNSDGHSFTRV